MPKEVEMCEFYTVETDGNSGVSTCTKGRRVELKCLSKRTDCPDYNPSIGLTLEEVKAKFGDFGGVENG